MSANSKSKALYPVIQLLMTYLLRVFEVSGSLPVNKDLTVQVWDKDLTSSDDLIGETFVDLENRYLTRHRATLGLAKQYHV